MSDVQFPSNSLVTSIYHPLIIVIFHSDVKLPEGNHWRPHGLMDVSKFSFPRFGRWSECRTLAAVLKVVFILLSRLPFRPPIGGRTCIRIIRIRIIRLLSASEDHNSEIERWFFSIQKSLLAEDCYKKASIHFCKRYYQYINIIQYLYYSVSPVCIICISYRIW